MWLRAFNNSMFTRLQWHRSSDNNTFFATQTWIQQFFFNPSRVAMKHLWSSWFFMYTHKNFMQWQWSLPWHNVRESLTPKHSKQNQPQKTHTTRTKKDSPKKTVALAERARGIVGRSIQTFWMSWEKKWLPAKNRRKQTKTPNTNKTKTPTKINIKVVTKWNERGTSLVCSPLFFLTLRLQLISKILAVSPRTET